MNIDGVCSVADFEVIEIVDVSQPYLALKGLEWDFDNQVIIDLKRREMIFQGYDTLRPIRRKAIHRTNKRE